VSDVAVTDRVPAATDRSYAEYRWFPADAVSAARSVHPDGSVQVTAAAVVKCSWNPQTARSPAAAPVDVAAVHVAAAPAVAATTGRLLGLDADAIAHAIALAVLSTPRSLRGSGEDGRWLSFGLAVTSGFHAALAARSGSRGDLRLLDQDSGHGGTSGSELFPGLRAALEQPWEPGHGLAGAHLKQWASAGQVAAAIDAVGVLQDAQGFEADDVLAVDIHVPPAYRWMIDQPSGSGRMWSLVSAQYQIAARLLHPQDLFNCARPVLRDSAAFRRLMGIVRVHEDELLAARHPESYPARAAVTLRGGMSAGYLSDGRSPTPHWDWESLLAKARAVAAHAAVEQRIHPLHEAISGFSDSIEFLRAALPAVLPFQCG